MKTRLLLAALCLLLAAPFVFSAGTGETTTAAKQLIEYEVVSRISKDRVPASRPTYFQQELIKRFDMQWNYQDIPEPEYEQKVMLLVAAGEEIDIFQLGGVMVGTKLGLEGYLKPIDDFIAKMPNYRKMFTDAQWSEAYQKRALSDGKAYVLPTAYTPGGNLVYAGWIYKKSTWDELGLPLPKTVEELGRQLATIKQHYPDAIGISTRSTTLVYDFAFAFRTGQDWYVDYDLTDGKTITYGPTTNKYRDMLIFANDLYGKGLIDPEFPTVTSQKWGENMARGVGYADFDYPTRAPWAEDLEKPLNPDVDWECLPYYLASEKYPKGSITTATVDYSRYSETDVMIPTHLSGEKLDRLLNYFDWTTTKEGELFTVWGVEGVTYDMLSDGTPRLYSYQYLNDDGSVLYDKKPIIDPSTGKQVEFAWQMGFPPASPDLGGPIMTSPLNRLETKEYKPLNALVRSGQIDMFRDAFWNILWKFTPEEDQLRNDLETVLKDTRDSYIIQFVLGQLDPSSDADWQKFQQALKNAKVDEIIALRNKVMARIPANQTKPSY